MSPAVGKLHLRVSQAMIRESQAETAYPSLLDDAEEAEVQGARAALDGSEGVECIVGKSHARRQPERSLGGRRVGEGQRRIGHGFREDRVAVINLASGAE